MRSLLRPIESFGRYTLFVAQLFRRPHRWDAFGKRIVEEVWSLTIRSIWLVGVVSLFVGAVITIEMAHNLAHPLLPQSLIGYATRDILLLEFSSTIIALVLAGKIGGSIASELGTMRITEQIDALEAMGIDSRSYLVLPRLLAAVFFFPLLTLMSFTIALGGGWLSGMLTGAIASQDYLEGIQLAFRPYYLGYTCMKMSVFAFVIVTIPAYQGYNVHGGSYEVGRASTQGVVSSSISLLLLNLLLTKLFLV